MGETTDARDHLRSDLWPVGTQVQLMGVPWDEAYRDVVAWESAEARDAWFESRLTSSWHSVQFNYLRPGEPVAVPVPYSSAYQYNYLVVRNPQQPVDDEGPERAYYYFVVGVTYLSPQASLLQVQLDVMTTYAGQIELGRAFVERGHIAVANEGLRDPGTGEVTGLRLNEYLSLPEGIDVGSEYYAVHREFLPLADPDNEYYCVVISTANLTLDPGTVSEPALAVAGGGWAGELPTGASVYAFESDRVGLFMDKMRDRSWVAQCILSLYVVPSLLVPINAAGSATLFGEGDFPLRTLGSLSGYTEGAGTWATTTDVLGKFSEGVGVDFSMLKLLCYPYSVLEASTLTGSPVMLKPQDIVGTDIRWGACACGLLPFARAVVFPIQYGAQYQSGGFTFNAIDLHNEEQTYHVGQGDWLDMGVVIDNFPQFAIVNNNYITYLASSVNSRRYNYQSAGWQLDRANAIAVNAYGNAVTTQGAQLANATALQDALLENASRSRNQAAVESVVGGLSQVAHGLNGVTPGTMAAGVAGGVASALMGVAGAANQYANQANMAGTQFGMTTETIGAQREVAGNNLALANMVNQGDYQNRVAGIDATVQDAALTPPSTVGQMGGEGFNYENGLVGIQLTWKTIGGASRAAVIDYFRRYGYAVRRFLPLGTVARLLCMSRFAYWRVLETTVTCAQANETERQAIRGVFEKGVTLWDAPESIGATALEDNQPKPGYSY